MRRVDLGQSYGLYEGMELIDSRKRIRVDAESIEGIEERVEDIDVETPEDLTAVVETVGTWFETERQSGDFTLSEALEDQSGDCSVHAAAGKLAFDALDIEASYATFYEDDAGHAAVHVTEFDAPYYADPTWNECIPYEDALDAYDLDETTRPVEVPHSWDRGTIRDLRYDRL